MPLCHFYLLINPPPPPFPSSWGKETNFETGTRNTLLWRVPGQSVASRGRNLRLVEMLDWFPTVVDLAGLPVPPKCRGLDQPPTVECLQGDSYADEFGLLAGAGGTARTGVAPKYAFSQWPEPSGAPSLGVTFFRMAYSVRSADGFRLTEYVPYSLTNYTGTWPLASDPGGEDNGGGGGGDLELYAYAEDPHEMSNVVGFATHAGTVARLRLVLRRQFVPGLAP